MDDMLLMKDLTDHERLMFQNEMNSRRKDVTAGVLLALFLRGLGVHRFYMGQVGFGVVYLVFC